MYVCNGRVGLDLAFPETESPEIYRYIFRERQREGERGRERERRKFGSGKYGKLKEVALSTSYPNDPATLSHLLHTFAQLITSSSSSLLSIIKPIHHHPPLTTKGGQLPGEQSQSAFLPRVPNPRPETTLDIHKHFGCASA